MTLCLPGIANSVHWGCHAVAMQAKATITVATCKLLIVEDKGIGFYLPDSQSCHQPNSIKTPKETITADITDVTIYTVIQKMPIFFV